MFNRRPDDKLIVQFNAKGQPIGENARPFATLCGIIVRTPGNAPLQVKKWAGSRASKTENVEAYLGT